MKITTKGLFAGLLGGLAVGSFAGYLGGRMYGNTMMSQHKHEYIDPRIGPEHQKEYPEYASCRWDKYHDPDGGYNELLKCDSKETTKELNDLADGYAAPLVNEDMRTTGMYIFGGIVGGSLLLGGTLGFSATLCCTQQSESKQPLSINAPDEKNYQTIVNVKPDEASEEKRNKCCLPFFNKNNKVVPMEKDRENNNEYRKTLTL